MSKSGMKLLKVKKGQELEMAHTCRQLFEDLLQRVAEIWDYSNGECGSKIWNIFEDRNKSMFIL